MKRKVLLLKPLVHWKSRIHGTSKHWGKRHDIHPNPRSIAFVAEQYHNFDAPSYNELDMKKVHCCKCPLLWETESWHERVQCYWSWQELPSRERVGDNFASNLPSRQYIPWSRTRVHECNATRSNWKHCFYHTSDGPDQDWRKPDQLEVDSVVFRSKLYCWRTQGLEPTIVETIWRYHQKSELLRVEVQGCAPDNWAAVEAAEYLPLLFQVVVVDQRKGH